MDIRSHFAMLARYNLWATRRLLLEHVVELGDADYRRDCGLFFKSVHGTLNHLLVTEQLLWLRRFAEGVSPRLALNAEIEVDRLRLSERLLEGAARWEPLIAEWPAARFDARLEYVATSGHERSIPFAAALSHVFNHGTHHRGQITAGLTSMGHRCPELDLPWMLVGPRDST
jgi:uncharacterized damage-inducible protein DinB